MFMCCALSNTLPHPPNFHWVSGMCSCWATTYIRFSWTREQILGPRARKGAVWVEFPKFCCLQIQWKVRAELHVVPVERDEPPKDLRGQSTFCLLLCLQRELKEPAGNCYLSLEKTWVWERNPKTCFLSSQSRRDCKRDFNSILVCVPTLFFLYLVSKYENCNSYILYCHSWKRILYAAASRKGLF